MGEDTETDMRSRLVVMYKEQAEENVSSLSLGDQSYIMDLANQRHFRAERRREEAMEEALELYKSAVEEGAPEGVELFKILMEQTLQDLTEENREKDRLQDEWLEAALQEEMDRQQRNGGLNVSNHTLSKSNHSRGDLTTSVHGPPSIYNGCRPTLLMRQSSTLRMLQLDQQIHDEEKKIVLKKIKKAERLMQEIVREKGNAGAASATRKYKDLQKKIKQYRATLKKAEKDELKISKHSRSVMYDWGEVDKDTKTQYEMEEDESSNSSQQSFENSIQSPRIDENDLEWAKQVVAKLNLDNDNDPVQDLQLKDVSVKEEKQKRPPNKNASFSTIMATTQRISGHELRPKTKLGNQKLFPLHHLAVTKEEDDMENSDTAFISTGSSHTEASPPKSYHLVPKLSPGKRKSPSWKTADAIKLSPVKHLVTDVNTRQPIGAPPLSENLPNQLKSESIPCQTSPAIDTCRAYTLQDFKQGTATNVDMTKWEQFLSNEEFEKHFRMMRADFDKLPKWKQQSMKRQLRTW